MLLSQLVEPRSRAEAARTFYDALVLQSMSMVTMTQAGAFADIEIALLQSAS